MKPKLLSVRLHGKSVGVLQQQLSGKLEFKYDHDASTPVSIGMPIREQPYGDLSCEAFFGGYLPESESVKKAIGAKYHINHKSTFSLLKAIGHDCAGAISFEDIENDTASHEPVALEGNIISDDILYDSIHALPQQPLFMGFDELKLSLAGAQDKAAVCLIDNQIAIPEHGCPTTHIIKPAVPGYENIIENEFLCMQAAKKVGLRVPNIEIRQTKNISYLLIERFDRHVQNNFVERIHQEDFCQAQGVLSAKKYQNEGGPGFKQCFDLLKNTTQPAIDRNHLAAMMIFNFLIGNMDAHGKNFSLLHHQDQTIQLTPCYDLICTMIYPTLSTKMAMKIGGEYSLKNILPKHWEKLCIDINYSYPAIKQLLKKQGEIIINHFKSTNTNHITDQLYLWTKQHIEATLNDIEK